jgi:hypothetical protein
VLILDVNPLDDLSVFADTDRVTGVWRAGVRVKG